MTTLSGILQTPDGTAIAGAKITFEAVRNSEQVTFHATSSLTTGSDGSYSLTLPVGSFKVFINYDANRIINVGVITILDGSVDGTLNDYLLTNMPPVDDVLSLLGAPGGVSLVNGAMDKAQNLNDVASISSARTNLDVDSKDESQARSDAVLSSLLADNGVDLVGGAMAKSQNLADIASSSSARANLDVYSKAESEALTTALSNALSSGSQSVDVNLGLTGSVLRSLIQKGKETLSVMDFGATGDGVTDDCLAFQRAVYAAYLMGGARVYVPTPAVEYRWTYPVFLFSNTELFGTGPSCRIVMENPTLSMRGRGCIVIGSSYEVNRDKAIANYNAGTFPNASVTDTTFVNPVIGAFLRDNQSFVQSHNCSVHDLYIVAKYTGTTLDGGYGINMVNSQYCSVYNIWGEGWTQLIGMGSDVSPETPSNYECHAYDLVVVNPNQSKTYYSIGFIANSSDCSIRRAKQSKPITAGTQNGSGVATNATEYCEITDIFIPNLGRTVSSEGVLINNSRGTSVRNIYIGNAVTAVATYFTLTAFNDTTKPNMIDGVTAVGCDQAIGIRAKYATFDNVSSSNCIQEVYFGNLNASGNVLKFKPVSFKFYTDQFPLVYFQNNTVKGYIPRLKYVRPADLMLSDKSSAQTVSTNKSVSTKPSTDLLFLYNIPDYMNAIVDIRFFMTFAANSLTGNPSGASKLQMDLRRMVAFNGNTGTAPYIELTNSRTSVSDTLLDTNLVIQATATTPGYIPLRGSANGLDASLDLLISMTNNVLNNVLKEGQITYLGE
jgi:hypothetical protein